ncbi:hypothetical protein [Actinomadura sp. WMMB 499]|uniref:hypothetical protein n=1 Tax=Actinomadura sp. WMMB 499 TaxID=1219491 RepID=UPI0012488F1D|nr:hypothetical protein [Actinomadura sp. WMMB 499]QFG22851.1 hypothetical protein F7P10_18750 [Actinomadura sp. WMMB 499]
MPDRIEAALLALDAYQQNLLPSLTTGHRESRAEAEGLIHGLVGDLLRYAEYNDLGTVDFLDQLVRTRLDHDSYPLALPDHFRLNTEVQFRQNGRTDDTPAHRGFIDRLKASPTGRDACTLRVPGLAEPLHARTSDLRVADPIRLVPTRTTGIVFSALEAEAAIVALSTELLRTPSDGTADPKVLADLAELSGTLANWSGTTPGGVLRHFRETADNVLNGREEPVDAPTPAELAATAFPDGIAEALQAVQPPPGNRPSPQASPGTSTKRRP